MSCVGIFLSIFFPLVLFAVEGRAADTANLPTTVTDFSVPGLERSGYGDESTLTWLKELGSFRGLPAYPRIYVSADAGGDYPLGDDSNPGTPQKPIRTLGKVEDLWANGELIFVFDAGDSWNTASDHSGTGNQYTFTGAPCAVGTELCVALISSDPSGARRPSIDCNGLFAGAAYTNPGLFYDPRTTDTGALAIANFTFNNCPATNATAQDLVYVSDQGTFVGLNLHVPNLQGSSNQIYTNHNANAASQVILLNTECTIVDLGECFRNVGNADSIVIGGSFTTIDDPSTATAVVAQTGIGAGASPASSISVIGAQFSMQATLTASKQVTALNITHTTDEVSKAFVGLSSFEGFTNASTFSAPFGFGASVAGTTTVDMYKNSVSEANYAFQGTAIDASDVMDITLACMLLDGVATTLFRISECSNVSLSATNMIFDEANAVTAYRIAANTSANSTDFATDSTAESCASAPWTWSGTAVTDDQFNGIAAVAVCQDAGCKGLCTTSKTHRFYNNHYIPKWVTGAAVDIIGFKFSGVSNVGP